MGSGSKHNPPGFVERQRELRLETLHDLLVALHAHRSEPELATDLLQRVCAALDPAAAVAVTRDAYGAALACASVGFEVPPSADAVIGEALWRELVALGTSLARSQGSFAGRSFGEALVAPIAHRGALLGLVAVFDKEGRAGASNFLPEDRRFLESVAAVAGVSLDNLRALERLTEKSERLEEENRRLREQLAEEVGGHRIVAHAPAMRKALEVVERVAPRSVNVLVRGESGTGKELVAKLLHERSGRRGTLIAVNCAALPDTLLESELFGIEGGVATGVEARPGTFELADGGTLFLDEIADLQLHLQVKLLRALQEREILRVGGRRPIRIDVRLVAATQRSLLELVHKGEFRDDLYYRLKGVELELPPLRDRREDIPHMVRYFVERFCHAEGLAVPAIDEPALSLLLAYDFPGNVRELQNLLEGAVSLADGTIGVDLLRSLLGSAAAGAGPEALDLDTVERRHIRRVLRIASGNKSEAARLLGIDRRTLARRGF